MKKLVSIILICILWLSAKAQDTIVNINNTKFTLAEVIVRNNFDYATVLKKIKEDTTFYKAFRNLRVLQYSAYNDIKMVDKIGGIKASLSNKVKQTRKDGCRYTEIVEENTTGDFYSKKKQYNYQTAEMYKALFFSTKTVCGENNIVKNKSISTSKKHGMDKHKEQLKMLFFNPGKKVPGIPFIGDKLDLYDDDARKLYDYKLDIKEKNNKMYYVFSIIPKPSLGLFKKDKIVIDEMITWFDQKTLEIYYRKYSMSYKAGVYDFNVNMEVEMTNFKGFVVPKVLRYYGDWDIVFKKREKSFFTSSFFNFSLE